MLPWIRSCQSRSGKQRDKRSKCASEFENAGHVPVPCAAGKTWAALYLGIGMTVHAFEQDLRFSDCAHFRGSAAQIPMLLVLMGWKGVIQPCQNVLQITGRAKSGRNCPPMSQEPGHACSIQLCSVLKSRTESTAVKRAFLDSLSSPQRVYFTGAKCFSYCDHGGLGPGKHDDPFKECCKCR